MFYQTVQQNDMKYYDADRNLTYDHNPQVRKAFDYKITATQSNITTKLTSFTEN